MIPSLNDQLRFITLHIRRTRTEKNIKQEYMAAKLGISQNAYSKIELG